MSQGKVIGRPLCGPTKRPVQAFNISVSRLALLACMGSTGGLIAPERALADCLPSGGGNYVCSGITTTPQSISDTNPAVTTAGGFNVNATGTALTITGNGATSYVDTIGSNLTGTASGLIVTNTGVGTTTINTNGTITGTSATGDGINAFAANAAGTGVSVNAAAVAGGRNGIYAYNFSSGATNVVASGQVTGTSWYGIAAANGALSFGATGDFGTLAASGASNPTNLTVQASGGVSGGLTGVLAINQGAGVLQVDTRGGAVSGGTRDGIVALNYILIGTPTDLSVMSDAVSGARNGLVAMNAGAGSNTVTANGAVSGASGYGIAALNGSFNIYDIINDGVITSSAAAGTDLTVIANSTVSGGAGGIYAYNRGTGATSVTATGTVTGTGATADGIYAYANNTAGTGLSVNAAAVSGGRTGIFARNDGGGLTNVTTTGTVSGAMADGINAFANGSAGTGVSVNAAAVSGGRNGIYAYNFSSGATNVVASGQVTGTSWYGIAAANGALSFGATGDFGTLAASGASNPTNLTVQASGGVSGGLTGVLAINQGAGMLQVDTRGGAVSGGTRDGIVALNYILIGTPTDLSVMSDAVSGARNGLVAMNAGAGSNTVTANGAVSGASGYGIAALNGSFNIYDIINDGVITSSAAAGTDLTVIANSTVSGGAGGIYAYNRGTGATSVTATGTVTGTGATADGIYAYANNTAGTGLSVNAAAVSGGRTGIFARNDGGGLTNVTTTGTVSGAMADGINAFANGSAGTGVSVNAAAVSGGRNGIYAYNFSSGATNVVASGQVTGTSWYGIAAANGALSFGATGDFGTLAASGASNPTNLTVQASGGVSGGLTGVLAINQGAGMLQVDTRGGAVSGGTRDGIVALNYILIGTPTDLSVMSDAVSGARNGLVAMNAGAGSNTVTANGAVSGASGYGIAALNGSFNIYDIINDGVITSSAAAGTDLTVIANSTVSGGAGGIYAYNRGTGATSVTATGTVTGTGATADGIYAYANNTAGTGLSVNAAAVSGGRTGISAQNNGGGLTNVTATGTVTGGTGDGIDAFAANATGTGVSVNAATVTGGRNGIYAYNYGGGATNVAASGQVTGTSWYGIAAANGSLSFTGTGDFGSLGAAGGPIPTNLTVQASGGVSGGLTGVLAINRGIGVLQVDTRGGAVSGGTRDGIVAYNFPFGFGAPPTDLSVMSDAVSGARHGLVAMNGGTGSNTVTANGAVSGASGYGIAAVNGSSNIYSVINGGVMTPLGAAGTDLTVTANSSVSGGVAGIYTNNQGSGPTHITARGDVRGGTTAIDAISVGAPITIDVASSGSLRNASSAPTDLALRTAGGPATVNNAGVITGVVQLGAAGNALNNSGTWNTAGGISTFGGATDTLTNLAGGVINAGGSGAVATTTFDNLGTFVNQGRVNLANGQVGDILQINGNARFEAGSVYAFDIGGVGNSDRILVSGSAQLAGTLMISQQPGLWGSVGTRYTILTATGGVSGTWSSVPSTAFLTFQDTYDGNNSYLELVQSRAFVAAALTPNQFSTASALDTIPKSGQLFSAVGLLPNDVVARQAFDQMSGEVHPSVRTALIDDSRFARDGMLGRLRSAFDAPGAAPVPVMSYAPGGPTSVRVAPAEQFSIWGQAYGSWGHWNGNSNAARLNRSSGGLTAGLDTPIFGSAGFPVRVGLMAGYSNTNFSVGGRSSSGTSDNYHLGAYAGTQIGGFGLRAGLAHTWHDIRTNRFVAFPGFSDLLRANYSGNTTQVFGDLGYKINFGALAVEPFANLAYLNLTTAGFREVGGVAALSAAGARSSQTFTTLGARGSMLFDFAGYATTLRGSLGWRHAFNAVVPGSTFAFAGSAPFTITGIAIARDAAVVEAGLDVAFAPGATLGISYGGQFARNALDHAIKGNLAVRF